MDSRKAHLDFLVEGYTMQLFLEQILPRLLPADTSFDVFNLGGKSEFLKKFPKRLRGHANWLPTNPTHRVVLVVDSDTDDCAEFRENLVAAVHEAGLSITSRTAKQDGQVLPRIAVEMLEAWYFGDPHALAQAYGSTFKNLSQKRGLREPDAIRDPARRLENLLSSVPKHKGGLKKIELTTDIAPHIDVENNSSPSFQRFRDGVRFLTTQIQECHAS
ncbi:MAG: DUF4276 family protein [Arachnia propionica]|uniref:DUF4276 family protein n=1 Tax=Arachnia propionica TaxID=1750 RepID=UPI00270D92EF|nr:DUF4276 family protein [Arachnia propionica]